MTVRAIDEAFTKTAESIIHAAMKDANLQTRVLGIIAYQLLMIMERTQTSTSTKT